MSDGTFALSSAVELAVVERGGFIESRHAGSAVVIGADGEISRSLGDPDSPVFGRSALKPFQALAALASGVELSAPELAVATASHAGTLQHVALVNRILERAGLTDDALQCVPAWPRDSVARYDLVREGLGPAAVYMECSGKHAAMIYACVLSGWEVEGYLDPEHPLQKHVVDTVERLTGEKIAALSIDGCGAPVMAVSLTGLARGVHRIATASETSPFPLYRKAASLRTAVLENPWAIDGAGRPDTIIAERLGVFAKHGAEGISVMAAPDGTTAAVKVLDGAPRAASITALTLLVQAGAVDEAAGRDVIDEISDDVLGGVAIVGRVSVTI